MPKNQNERKKPQLVDALYGVLISTVILIIRSSYHLAISNTFEGTKWSRDETISLKDAELLRASFLHAVQRDRSSRKDAARFERATRVPSARRQI